MPHPAMAPIVKGGVRYIEMPHELGKVGLGGLYHQMKVVVHEHVAVKPYPVDG